MHTERSGIRDIDGDAELTLLHNDLWNPSAVNYDNCVPGIGDISADPMFMDAVTGDYHLQAGSPCIDSGTNEGAPSTDLDGNPRPIDGDSDGIAVVDMGAFEFIPIEILEATVDIHPHALNLKSKGRWITSYIQLPEGYNVEDIDVSTILLDGVIPTELRPTAVGDYDSDGITNLMVKFNRRDLIAILSVGEATLTITGEVNGIPFEGSDTIRVRGK